MDRKPLTRRAMAQVLAGAAVVASTPALVENPARPATTNALIEVLARFRKNVLAGFTAKEVERLAIAAHAAAAKDGIGTLEAAAVRIVGRSLDEISLLGGARELRSLVARNIRADYAADRIESVAGWFLSRTELLIVAQTVRKPTGR